MWHVQKFCNDNVLSLPRSSSSSDWFKKFPCGMMNQKLYLIWAVWHIVTLTGISVLAPQASFCGETAVGSQTVQWWIHGGGGAGAEGWAPPIIRSPNCGQKYFLETSPPPPPPIIWRSGSTTAVSCFVMLEFSEFLHCRCNASISYCILLIKQLGIWVLINFSHLQNRCLFEVGAYLKLGA